MKKLVISVLLLLSLLLSLVSCNMIPQEKEDVITIKDGYLVVNGVKTEYEVKSEDKTEDTVEDKMDCGKCDCTNSVIVTIVDGYIALNGIKTEYQVEDGKCDHEYVISVINGYLAVNGVKTEYPVAFGCNHFWKTVTTAPTCTAEGYDTMTCPLCDKSVRVNETPKADHTYAETYSIDNDYHWYACTVCGDAKDKELHTLDGEGGCTICEMPISSTPGVVYDVSADGTYAEVIAYNGTATKVKIAEEYNGLPVKKIYNDAFKQTSIASVVIPNSVTSIGASAFYESSIASVVIGNGVTSIGKYAFACSGLTSITIPNSVTSIDDDAFYACLGLTSVVIPDSVISIGKRAFEWCMNLASVDISSNVISIGVSAFGSCHTSLYTEYEHGEYIGSSDNPYAVLIDVINKNMSSYSVHEDARTIADGAFQFCARMTSIIIPDSVTNIGEYVFWGCTSLTDVYYTGSEAEWQAIEIGYDDSWALANATKHYNYVPEE